MRVWRANHVLTFERAAKRKKDKAEPRWQEGIWLGIIGKRDEVIVGSEKGTVKTRAIRRMREEMRWSQGFTDTVRGTLEQLRPGRESEYIPTGAEHREQGR